MRTDGLKAANQARACAAEAAFRARLAELGAVPLGPYRNAVTPVRVRCAAGHESSPRPNAVQQGQGICQACGRRTQNTARSLAAEDRFRVRLAELDATLLEPEWLGVEAPHRVRCAAGHECWPWPSSTLAGKGICRRCVTEGQIHNRLARLAEDRFRVRLAELDATLLEPWRGCQEPHRVRCAAGHECWPRPLSVSSGQGVCRYCAGQVWDAFYVVSNPAAQRIKFGVTSGDPRPRLYVHKRSGYSDVVRLLTGLPGTVAPDAERAVLAALRLAGHRPLRGREYFDSAALAVVLDVADGWLSNLIGRIREVAR